MEELGPLVKETEKETGLLEQREYRIWHQKTRAYDGSVN